MTAETHEHAHSSFRAAIRERLISIRTMNRPLRLVTGLAFAWIIAAALLIVLRDHGPQAARVPVYVVDNQLVNMGMPVLVASIVLLSMGWAYLLTGAVHAHWAPRIAGLGLFTWAMWNEGLVPSGGWPQGAAWALLGGIWLVAGVAHLYDVRSRRRGEGHRSHMTRLVLVTFVTIFLLVGGLYAVTWVSLRDASQLLFTEIFTSQLTTISVVLIPLLFIAGVDFADFAELTSDFVTRTVARARARAAWLLLGLVAAGAAATLGWQVWSFRRHLDELGQELATAVAALALVLLVVWAVRLGRGGRRFAQHVPYAAFAVLGILSFTITWLYLYLPASAATQKSAQDLSRVDAKLSPYNHDGDPRFSLEHPQFWETKVAADNPDAATIVTFDGFQSGDPVYMEVVSAAPGQFKSSTDMLSTLLISQSSATGGLSGLTPYLAGAAQDHGFERFDVRTVANTPGKVVMHGTLWARRDGDGRTWVLFGFTPEGYYSFNEPGFAAIADSWQPSLRAGPAGTSSGDNSAVDRALAVDLGVTVVIAVGLGLWSRRRQGPRSKGRVATAALYAGIVAVLIVAAVPGSLLRLATGSTHGFIGLHIEGIQAFAGLLALAWCAWIVARRRVAERTRPLLAVGTLLLGLQIVAWIYGLFTGASDASGRFSIAEAVILVLAFMWDIAFSGETITNGGNRWLPRHARVSLYFGYVILVVANILYFSSLQFPSGAQVEAQFEDNSWVQSGMVSLGVPLLLALFAVKIAGWWRERDAVAAPPQAAEAAA